jgi:CubicO group peptidase (beta-lactamase class C family)
MNRKLSWIFAAICCASLLSQPAAAGALDDPLAVEAFVDGVVLPAMKANSSPSGTVAIVYKGELILAKGYGYQDVDKQIAVDPYKTLFRPGSVSKLFTWVAVMQQVEQGKLDLDADVNTYLENFKIKDTFDQPVTLRHILTHTAGFEDGALGYLIIDDPERVIPLAEAMEKYQPARVNPPGAQTAYSNYATAIAGLIVSNVSGLSFNDYIQKNIFDPLGMKNSSFVEPLPEPLASNMATSYSIEAGKFTAKPFEIIANFGPAGAQSATSVDMVKFGQAILNGGELNGQRILKAETVKEMLTRNFSHDDRLMGMALGFYEGDYEGTRVVGHGGDTAYFHSFLGIDAEHDLTFFTSFGGGGGSAVRSMLFPAFYEEFFPRTEEAPVPPADFADRAGKYVGSYGFWRSNFSTLEKALGLSGGVQVAPTQNNTLMIAFAGKTKEYAEVEKNLFRETNPLVGLAPGISPRLVAFQENDSGAITGFVMDGLPFMSLRKLPTYATSSFNLTLLGLSLLVFLGVLLRRFFQRRELKGIPAADKSALKAATFAAASNWLVFIVGGIVIAALGEALFGEIPLLFKLWLVLPVIAFLAGLWLAFRCLLVWKNGLLAGAWARLRYTIVALSGLFLCWFYWFWNILGWQYK